MHCLIILFHIRGQQRERDPKMYIRLGYVLFLTLFFALDASPPRERERQQKKGRKKSRIHCANRLWIQLKCVIGGLVCTYIRKPCS